MPSEPCRIPELWRSSCWTVEPSENPSCQSLLRNRADVGAESLHFHVSGLALILLLLGSGHDKVLGSSSLELHKAGQTSSELLLGLALGFGYYK